MPVSRRVSYLFKLIGASFEMDGEVIRLPMGVFTLITGYEKGHFIGPTVFGEVKPGMQIQATEIFGPLLTGSDLFLSMEKDYFYLLL